MTRAEPGVHGDRTGWQGCGVRVPDAAAVAADTCGLASDMHIPKGGTFAVAKSVTTAAGPPADVRVPVAANVAGVVPNEHCRVAPVQTRFAMLPPERCQVIVGPVVPGRRDGHRWVDEPGLARERLAYGPGPSLMVGPLAAPDRDRMEGTYMQYDVTSERSRANQAHVAVAPRAVSPATSARARRSRPTGVLRPSQVPLPAISEALHGSSQLLAAPLKKEMEARLGEDLSDVRVHTDNAARASAAALGARAYTSGSHVVIGEGGSDKHTLAHELSHVVQQRQGLVAGTDYGTGLRVSDPSDRDERTAEENASRVMRLAHQPTPVARQGGEAVHPTGQVQGRAQTSFGPGNTTVIQRLGQQDYAANPNPAADIANVENELLLVIRANINDLDWTPLAGHIIAQNHDTLAPQGNASTFGGVGQVQIDQYVVQVLNNFNPVLQNTTLVFESTGGGICNGMGTDAIGNPQARTNVRVILDVSAVVDDELFDDQVDSIRVVNAYPIV